MIYAYLFSALLLAFCIFVGHMLWAGWRVNRHQEKLAESINEDFKHIKRHPSTRVVTRKR